MNTDIPDDPSEIRELLADASRDVYNGLIYGSMIAREHFDTYKRPINLSLAANITRYHAKSFLSTRRSPGSPYLLKNANNNGIAIRQDAFELKVLKGRDGDPPAPSKSIRSERFYEQRSPRQLVLFPGMFRSWTSGDWPLFAARSQTMNLILCWEVDPSYSVIQLQLMCPRQAWKYGQAVRLFWKRVIPNPIAGIIGVENVNDDTEDIDDLDIFFDEDEAAGGA
jgi:hypothetical protein